MTTLTKNRVPDAIGIATSVAGVALLLAVVASADPIGLSVGALIGGGFAFGVLGCGLKEAVARRNGMRPAASAEIVAMPHVADATASEFDDAAHPSFVPVTSLIEAQVERQRAERQREERRTALTRA